MNDFFDTCVQIGVACIDYGYTAVLLGVFLLAGAALAKLPMVRSTFLPASLVAGMLLLLFGPQVAGIHFPDWQLPDSYYAQWRQLPKELINVVFACLFLARPILPFRHMWRSAGPQVAFGQTLAWGQYAIGGLLALLVLVPLFGANPLTAALIEVSFEGGHGTVSGMSPIFGKLGFQEGRDLAMGLATVSLITALISGMLLVHWGRLRHHIKTVHHQAAYQRAYHRRILHDLRKQGVRLREHITPSRLANHIVLLAVAIGIGWLLWQGLLLIETLTWGAHSGVFFLHYVPMFPLCMFGGMIAHVIWRRLGIGTSRALVELMSSLALSVLIATAVGTMSLEYISQHPAVFGLLAFSGIAWILFGFMVFARRMFREHWFQNGIVNMGQSMGMTATGLLLLHIVDPEDKTSSMESFGYKQLMFEPFVGGGVITALSMPLILAVGLPFFTLLAITVCAGWMTLGLRYFGKMRVSDTPPDRQRSQAAIARSES